MKFAIGTLGKKVISFSIKSIRERYAEKSVFVSEMLSAYAGMIEGEKEEKRFKKGLDRVWEEAFPEDKEPSKNDNDEDNGIFRYWGTSDIFEKRDTHPTLYKIYETIRDFRCGEFISPIKIINELRLFIRDYSEFPDTCFKEIENNYNYETRRIFVECLRRLIIDENCKFWWLFEQDRDLKNSLISEKQRDFSTKLDEALRSVASVQFQLNQPETKKSQPEIAEQSESKTNKANTGKPQQDFVNYLHHDNKDALMKKLHELLDGRRGREVAKVLMALEDKHYLVIPTKGLDKVRESMILIFGNVGTKQSINNYYRKKDPNGNYIIPQSEIQQIIELLP
jgi:hypothetical protein